MGMRFSRASDIFSTSRWNGKITCARLLMRSCLRHVDAGRFKRLHFFEQRGQVDHHAVADHGLHARAQNAAGDQLENEFLLADEDGVAGVVAALIARDDIETLGEQIDDFAFALIAPLRAKNDHVAH